MERKIFPSSLIQNSVVRKYNIAQISAKNVRTTQFSSFAALNGTEEKKRNVLVKEKRDGGGTKIETRCDEGARM